MPFYIQRGSIPPKRHIQHRDKNGKLYYEQLMSREGFADIYANVYHLHMPTKVRKVGEFQPFGIAPRDKREHRHYHLETFKFAPKGNWLSGRRPVMFNKEVALYTAAPAENADFFYRNGRADEVLFIHHGTGVLNSQFGRLPFGPGDYLVIPGGLLYQLHFDDLKDVRLFVIEAYGPIEFPKRYRNKYGQLMEHAPFCERDMRTPEWVEPRDEQGSFPIYLKMDDGIQHFDLAHHPFDLVGWDGFYYPWAMNIKDFMPITGKVHQPPPVHQHFDGPGFVICSFCPRLFDYHELSIPAPYAHSNIDSDEVLYYVEGDFMSRKGVSDGSITLHPFGLPHGPQPGRYEGSIGKKETVEYAVMVDTFRPLTVAKEAEEVDDAKYPYSWLE